VKNLTRRDALKLASIGSIAVLHRADLHAAQQQHPLVPVWEVFELTLDGPSTGNPFVDVTLSATFSFEHRTITLDGFYDGDGKYKVRFMPDTIGPWNYKTSSATSLLDNVQGSFAAVAALAGAHGPVRAHNIHHFAHADGTPFFPFGTTCYAWVHQSDDLQQQTLQTLRTAPFNKVRMCVFPKHYEYNHNEPPLYPFDRTAAGINDFTRLNPIYFRHLEQRIGDLRALGIEADLIVFHPYDNWGYSTMPPEADDRYLKYLIARFCAYRNIWWSMANEYDLMRAKSKADWDRFFHIVEQKDAFAHLRSIHFSREMYDYARPWVTHASLQNSEFATAPEFIANWRKPIMFDEVQYEGNLNRRWGNISAEELSRKFWLGVIVGCYVTHGETLLDPASPLDENTTPTLWWSHGGKLHGASPAQIAFLRRLVEDTATHAAPGSPMRAGFEASTSPYYLNAVAYQPDGKTAHTILYYFDSHQPIWYEFPLPDGTFTAEWLDPIAAKIVPQSGTYSGKAKLRLPGKPFQALRFKAVRTS
jgi:hypothetical protein